MCAIRVNTVTVNLSVLPKRPKPSFIQKFLLETVKLNMKNVRTLQLNNILNCVHIEMIDEQTAQRFAAENLNKHYIEHDGVKYKIPIFLEDGSVNVRVHDFSWDVQSTAIVEYLAKYGEVISLTREVWKNFFVGVYNGVRVIRMRVKKPIPSYIKLNGETSLVTYPNQIKTCINCHQTEHPNTRCLASDQVQKQVTASNLEQSPKSDAHSLNKNKSGKPKISFIGNNSTDDNSSEHETDSGENNLAEDIDPHSKRRLSTGNGNERKRNCLDEKLNASGAIKECVIHENSRVTRSHKNSVRK